MNFFEEDNHPRDEEPKKWEPTKWEPTESQGQDSPTLPYKGSNETQPSSSAGAKTQKINESETKDCESDKKARVAKKSFENSESQCEIENDQMGKYSVIGLQRGSVASQIKKKKRTNILLQRGKKIKKDPKRKDLHPIFGRIIPFGDGSGKVITLLLDWMKKGYAPLFVEIPAVVFEDSILHYIWVNLIGASDMLLKVQILHEMINNNPKLKEELGLLEIKRVDLYIKFYNIVRKFPNVSVYYHVPDGNKDADDLELFAEILEIKEYDNFFQRLYEIIEKLKKDPQKFVECFENLKIFMLKNHVELSTKSVQLRKKFPLFGFPHAQRNQNKQRIDESDHNELNPSPKEISNLLRKALKDKVVENFIKFKAVQRRNNNFDKDFIFGIDQINF